MSDNKLKKYFSMKDIPETTMPSERFQFPFSQLNWLTNGGVFGYITLITSGTNNGKTTIASQIINATIMQGYNVFGFFGEDCEQEARDRIYKQFTKYSDDNFVYTPSLQNGKQTNTGEYILNHARFVEAENHFQDKLFIYNNEIPADKKNLIDILEEARVKENCKIFLLDNCEMFDFDTDNENKGVKEIMIALRQWSSKNKCHILLIAHIRKVERDVIRPDIFDVKGTSAVTNISKNIITVMRTDTLDKTSKPYKYFAGILKLNGYDLDDCDCVLEVRKTKGRGLGFCCLKYNKYTNSYYEVKRSSDDKFKNKEQTLSVSQKEIDINGYTLVDCDDGDLPF